MVNVLSDEERGAVAVAVVVAGAGAVVVVVVVSAKAWARAEAGKIEPGAGPDPSELALRRLLSLTEASE